MNMFELKEKHDALYLLRLYGKAAIIFTIPTWKDFKSWRNIVESFPNMKEELKDYVFKKYVITSSYDGAPYELLPAGVIETVFNAICILSGSTRKSNILDALSEYRPYHQYNTEERLKGTMSTIFKITPRELENMYYPDIIKLLANTEDVMVGNVLAAPFEEIGNGY